MDNKGEILSKGKSFPVNSDKFDLSPKKSLFTENKKFFCPFCEHCNKIKDDNLDTYVCTINESKNIINRGFNFIIHSDVLSHTEIFKDYHQKENPSGQKDPFKFENLIVNFPKNNVTNRLSYQVLAHFLEALLEEKISLETIASPDVIEKFKTCLLSKGQAYKENSEKLEFDKELDSLFDEKTKTTLEKLIRSIF